MFVFSEILRNENFPFWTLRHYVTDLPYIYLSPCKKIVVALTPSLWQWTSYTHAHSIAYTL